VTTLYGRAPSESLYSSDIKDVVNTKGYVGVMLKEANGLIERLTDKVVTQSGLPGFDKYVRQQYMGNFLRGGYPVVLGGGAHNNGKPLPTFTNGVVDNDDWHVFNTFSRIHGDTERDYNNFQIDACFSSTGPGNFRDVL
jgi:hypothetical protein